MLPLRSLAPTALATLFVVAACGGAKQKSGATPADSAEAQTGGAPADSAAAGDDGDDGGGATIEQSHQAYLKGCNTAPDLAAFCDCSWTVVTAVLTPKQLRGDLDAYTKQQLTSEIRKACAVKIPERVAKEAYMGECAKAANEMTAYCACRWAELRKSYSVADLETPDLVSTDKFQSLKKPIAKRCSAKLSENYVADGFEQGCNKRPGLGAFCKCAWKEVRARMSLGEVADPGSTESPEFKAAMDSVGKKCQTFRPSE